MTWLTPTSRAELCQRSDAGEVFDYLCFWGHKARADGQVSNSCFSQWWPAAFTVDGVTYPTAEHYMMTGKARLFNDTEMAASIPHAKTPAEAKALGRKVKGYDNALWAEHCMAIVIAGNTAKFSQHPELGDWLRKTGHKVLVEASPVDPIWGIGLAQSDPLAQHPSTWAGQNLLGFALMAVRDRV